MTKNEYNYLLESIDKLKSADIAFNSSYRKYEITEEQIRLYNILLYQLDEVYIMANMLIENEMYRQDRVRRKREEKKIRE